MRHRRSKIKYKSRKERKEQFLKDCAKGNHGINYQPNIEDHYNWDKKSVYCRVCGLKTTINKLEKFWQKWVKDVFKYHIEAVKKLPPMKKFNKDGLPSN